jgi:hypothetical protein
MTPGRRLTCLLLLVAAGPLEAVAQASRASVQGQIVSRQTLLPVEGARIALQRLAAGSDSSIDSARVARSDSGGRFQFERLEAGRYMIAAAHLLDSLPPTVIEVARSERLEVELMVGAADFNSKMTILPELTTAVDPVARAMSVRDEFDYRRRIGVGQFITREMILQRNPGRVEDLFRMASGIEIRCGGGFCLPRFVRSPRNCWPTVNLDGAPADVRVLAGMLPRDIHAIEIYLGISEAPFELNSRGKDMQCGLIVVWTRLNSDERRNKQPAGSATP